MRRARPGARPRTCCNCYQIKIAFVLSVMSGFIYLYYISIYRPPHQTDTFRLPDGDLVQCIPIRDLKRSTSGILNPLTEPIDKSRPDAYAGHFVKPATQLVAAAKQSCPTGTVPIQSRPFERPSRYISPMSCKFLRRADPGMEPIVPPQIANHKADSSTPPASALGFNDFQSHKYAVAELLGPYVGTQGRFSIWQPHVRDEDFSLAQTGVSSVDANGKHYCLEAGWHIYRALNGDLKPRLFTHWTANGDLSTGCYNLQCPGFVQVSNKWLLGGSFKEISTFSSNIQYEIKIYIFQEMWSGDWWLKLNEDIVGYWPRHLFGPRVFEDHNTRIHWGGEVWHNGTYTDTQMGNGNHPSSSKKKAYVRNLKVVDLMGTTRDAPRTLTPLATYPQCCDVMIHQNQSYKSPLGMYAHFGGPGFNVNCVRF